MSNKQELEDLELEKKRLENDKLRLDILRSKSRSNKVIPWIDLSLKFLIFIGSFVSGFYLTKVFNEKEKKWELEKKLAADTLAMFRDSITETKSKYVALNNALFDLQDVYKDSLRKLVDSFQQRANATMLERRYEKLVESLLKASLEQFEMTIQFTQLYPIDSRKLGKHQVNVISEIKRSYASKGFKLVRSIVFRKGISLSAYLERNRDYCIVYISRKGSQYIPSMSCEGVPILQYTQPAMMYQDSEEFICGTKLSGDFYMSIINDEEVNCMLIFKR